VDKLSEKIDGRLFVFIVSDGCRKGDFDIRARLSSRLLPGARRRAELISHLLWRQFRVDALAGVGSLPDQGIIIHSGFQQCRYCVGAVRAYAHEGELFALLIVAVATAAVRQAQRQIAITALKFKAKQLSFSTK
jgi:hypothetical protein